MTASLAEIFRSHFAHEEHLYGWLLDRFADDLEAGGPTAEICRGHGEATRADAIQLRLLAGLHRIVLRGDAPVLAAYYPNLGGTKTYRDAWMDFRPMLVEHVDELRAGLDRAPQTNEVGRSAVLLVGLFEAVRRTSLRRIRLLEPGASAGLNLLVDRYRFMGSTWEFGPTESPLVIKVDSLGVHPEAFEIVERRGCDLEPVDLSTPQGRDYLTSWVWPFQRDRHARLAGALRIAADEPPPVDKASAGPWLEDQLAAQAGEDVLTVVWQSMTEQYWPATVSAGVREAVESARSRMPLVHLSMEGIPPAQAAYGWNIAEHGPTLRLDGELLAHSSHHGPPVILAR